MNMLAMYTLITHHIGDGRDFKVERPYAKIVGRAQNTHEI
jgi:hypothetical protein